jgi:hypothetical protein
MMMMMIMKKKKKKKKKNESLNSPHSLRKHFGIPHLFYTFSSTLICSTQEVRNVYSILVGRLKGPRPLVRARHGWEDNIRMAFRETGWEVVDWIHVAQARHQW